MAGTSPYFTRPTAPGIQLKAEIPVASRSALTNRYRGKKGLAFGGRTYKRKFGHHGGNQPVKDLTTGKIEITTQNHGFAVDIASIPDKEVELTHVNLNDRTVEGMRHRRLPIFSVQYHPEASPGPHDASYLFRRFVDLMAGERRKTKTPVSKG